jgi:hypothetical protein
MRLNRYEQETIISFNQAEDIAYVYTCSNAWMTHFEKKLRLQPTVTHGSYAREYECPKAWIKKPRKPRQLSEDQKLKLRRRLPQKSVLSEDTPCAVGEFGGKDGR